MVAGDGLAIDDGARGSDVSIGITCSLRQPPCADARINRVGGRIGRVEEDATKNKRTGAIDRRDRAAVGKTGNVTAAGA